jgi:hypothetical protein
MSTDDTPVVAIQQAIAALRTGTVVRPLDAEDLGALGTEARALVEQLVDVLQSVDRATADPRDPRIHDLATLRERLSGALVPSGAGIGDPREGIGESATTGGGRWTTPDD